MKKIILFLCALSLMAVSVLAISFYADTNLKGNKLVNVSNITFTDNTSMTTAAVGTGGAGWYGNATTNLNMSDYNITRVKCIYFTTGGSVCGN